MVDLRINVKQFKDKLLSERQRIVQEIKELENRAAKKFKGAGSSELSNYDEHPADVASEIFEKERDVVVGERFHMLLERIDHALAKIDDGSYGICDICGEPIDIARLKVIPYASLCLKCQRRTEIY